MRLLGLDRNGRFQTATYENFTLSAWTALGGVAAAGSPSAIMAPNGTLQVVVRGAGNYVYFAGQTAPGSSAYTSWRTATTQDETTTDPTALAVTSENTWVIAYRNDLGAPRLLRQQPPVTARTSSPAFVDIPLRETP